MKKCFRIVCLVLIIGMISSLLYSCKDTSEQGSNGSEVTKEIEKAEKTENTGKKDNNKPATKYMKAPSAKDGFKKINYDYKLNNSKTRIETITETREIRNPAWFALAPISPVGLAAGLIGYFTDTQKEEYVVDTYTVKYYKVLEVHNETIWASTPTYYTGGDMSLDVSASQMTQEGIQKTLTASINFNFGFDYYATAGAGLEISGSVTEIYSKSKTLAQSCNCNLSGYEPNKYYRMAIKASYVVYCVKTTNSSGELVETSNFVEYVDNSIFSRLEASSNSKFE